MSQFVVRSNHGRDELKLWIRIINPGDQWRALIDFGDLTAEAKVYERYGGEALRLDSCSGDMAEHWRGWKGAEGVAGDRACGEPISPRSPLELEFADARSGIIETMDIRLAGIRDAAAIAFVQVQSWKAIYRELVPQGDLDRLVVSHRCSVWEAVLRESNWQHRTGTLLAENDKRVVGFVSIGAIRDDGATRVAAVRALHLLEVAWDTTAGKQLLAAALGSLSPTRFEQAVVWVLEADKRARDLYEVSGWREDGAARVRDQQAFAVRLAEVGYRHALR